VEFERRDAPFLTPTVSVAAVMQQVLLALVPAAAAHVWFFGPGFVFNLLIATLFCALGEGVMAHLRGRRPEDLLSDFSVLVTAALLAFCLPSLTPWWVTATAALFGVVVAKHLYGGLGYNLFNPAMAGYVVVLVAFPAQMNVWIAPRIGDIDYQYLTVLQTLVYTLTGAFPDGITVDAVSRATPLDSMKTGLNNMITVTEVRAGPLMGDFGGRGWEWIGNFIAIGGFWLLIRKVIRWHIPVGVIAGLLLPTTVMYLVGPGTNPSPGFHWFSGASILCAFFIATDPVSAAASPKGRLIYGFGIGLFIYMIRTWGSYADGVAFAVLIMNMAVPLIDRFTRPHIVGHEREERQR
jgi:electron transport complex protein RnfD